MNEKPQGEGGGGGGGGGVVVNTMPAVLCMVIKANTNPQNECSQTVHLYSTEEEFMKSYTNSNPIGTNSLKMLTA